MDPTSRDIPDLLRSIGGLVFAVGAAALFVRETGSQNWSAVARLLIVLIPATILYGLALGAFGGSGRESVPPSRSVLITVALLLLAIALFELLSAVGASTNDKLYEAAVFAVLGLAAAYGTYRGRVAYAALLAALSLLLAWIFLWEKILGHPSANDSRWLLVGAAALLFVTALVLMQSKAIGAREVATAGGVAAVLAGVLGIVDGLSVAAVRLLTGLSTTSATVSSNGSVRSITRQRSGLGPLARHPETKPTAPLASLSSGFQHFGWDLYLLVASVALVWIGARSRSRGLGYVGGFGLLAFIISVGEQVTRIEAGKPPTHSLVGWPLALLIVGGLGLLSPILLRRER